MQSHVTLAQIHLAMTIFTKLCSFADFIYSFPRRKITIIYTELPFNHEQPRLSMNYHSRAWTTILVHGFRLCFVEWQYGFDHDSLWANHGSPWSTMVIYGQPWTILSGLPESFSRLFYWSLKGLWQFSRVFTATMWNFYYLSKQCIPAMTKTIWQWMDGIHHFLKRKNQQRKLDITIPCFAP